MTTEIVSVSRLVHIIQELVEENFVEVLVQGELANLSRPASGHCYFTLKDQRSQIRCVQFRSASRALRFQPENGLEVICRGRISVYPQRGDLQLMVDRIEPVGLGGLQLAFQQLKEKLQKEGLFAVDRKQQLPAFPTTVGIVTSATGAAIHDMLNVLRRRSSGLKVILNPAAVQGDGAAGEIARAIEELNAEGSCDVLIVGRGGGSLEDLWAFNEELLVRAIDNSLIPVISAVGHETDTTIADLVADLRAPTPSAAAELVVSNRLELEQHLDHLSARLLAGQSAILALQRARLNSLESRLRSPLESLPLQKKDLIGLCERTRSAMLRILEQQHGRVAVLAGRLDALSPLKVLERGYAIVTLEKDGSVLRAAEQVNPGDELHLQLASGYVFSSVLAAKKG